MHCLRAGWSSRSQWQSSVTARAAREPVDRYPFAAKEMACRQIRLGWSSIWSPPGLATVHDPRPSGRPRRGAGPEDQGIVCLPASRPPLCLLSASTLYLICLFSKFISPPTAARWLRPQAASFSELDLSLLQVK